MPTAFGKLEKFLRLEQSQGFLNRAVIGGFDGFAEIWRNEALRETQDQAEIKQINEIADLLLRYAEADPAGRSQAVNDLLSQLEQDPQERTPRQPPLHKPGSAPPPPPIVAPAPAAPPERPGTGLDAPVNTLPGVSTAYTARLRRLGIDTVGDLLYHFPHRYDDYSSLKPIANLNTVMRLR